MTNLRRLIALLTTLAVAWTALWPLVSSARALASSEPMALCHQAGMQVDPGEAPAQEGKQHCPLCIMAFYGAFSPSVSIPPLQFSVGSVSLDAYCTPLAADVAVHLPQGRAPPL
ncbi:MAG: DUF2946 family protein [Usitatibacter sp.]